MSINNAAKQLDSFGKAAPAQEAALLKYAVTLVSMPLIYVTGDGDWKEQ